MNDTIDLRDEQPPAPAVAYVDNHTPAPDPHQEAREAAFVATYEWDGKPLEPFTSGRRREWARMRAFEGPDPSFLDDAVKILWLCHMTSAQIVSARRNLAEMCAVCWNWADDNIPHERHDAMIELVDRILSDSQINQAVPIPTNGTAPGN